MALNPSNSRNLEQLALKGLVIHHHDKAMTYVIFYVMLAFTNIIVEVL